MQSWDGVIAKRPRKTEEGCVVVVTVDRRQLSVIVAKVRHTHIIQHGKPQWDTSGCDEGLVLPQLASTATEMDPPLVSSATGDSALHVLHGARQHAHGHRCSRGQVRGAKVADA